MQTTTLLYIVIAVLVSISISFFQYFYKPKSKHKINILLFFLRAISLFLLGLLFINPKIETKKIENIKPKLAVLVDNSLSTKYFKQVDNVQRIIDDFKKNTALQKKFEVSYFSFGNSLNILDSLSFNEQHTNISKAIEGINTLNKNVKTPIVLLSDGNQTIGNDYEFINSKNSVFPIVIGDTTQYKDLKITQLNVNKYSYIKNKFPVETLLFYEGKEPVITQFSIYNNGKTVFTKKVQFSAGDKSKTITANIKAFKEGQHYYTASLRELSGEKNIKNNSKNFSVEVLDEQSKVLIVTAFLHPDIGGLKKAIESNKQRTVDIKLIDKFNTQINDYQLVILYQPNAKFKELISNLQEQKTNYLFVSGAHTDWNFINKQGLGFSKKAIDKTENYGVHYNDGFLTFLQKDIGFNQFPPLKDKFGELTLSKPHQLLLFQKITGIVSKQPLLAVFDQEEQRVAAVFGEGIWAWRAASFQNENSFADFDESIGNLIQYLASTKKRNRLDVAAKSLYPANATITIAAFYTDKNYKFDNRASLEIRITNLKTKVVTKLPFSLVNNAYQVAIENLSAGNYSYKVLVKGENITKHGKFKITDFQVEEQFTNANYTKLQKLADKTGGKLSFSDKSTTVIDDLLTDTSFFTTQKSTPTIKNLIDWKWILFLILGLLTIEWFIRKYFGKI